MKLIEMIKNLFYRIKLTLFSDEYEHITYKFPISSMIERDSLYIDNYTQDNPNAILKYGVLLLHYYGRDVETIRKRCAKDKTLNEKEELQKLLDRYLFKGTKQNNDEYDRVGVYRQIIMGN